MRWSARNEKLAVALIALLVTLTCLTTTPGATPRILSRTPSTDAGAGGNAGSSSTFSPLVIDTSEYGMDDIQIDGDWMIWQQGGLRGLNLQTMVTTDIPIQWTDGTVVRLSGDQIVWSSRFYGHFYNLSVYDLVSGEQRELLTNKSNLLDLDVSGDTVAYVHDDIVYGNTLLSLLDLRTGEDRTVTNISDGHSDVDVLIDGSRVVWADMKVYLDGHRDYLGKLTVLDLESGEQTVVTPGKGPKSEPSLDGRRVVWTDGRGPDDDIWMYDFLEKWEYPICCSPRFQTEPDIYGTTVVWSDGRNVSTRDQVDVFTYDVGTGVEERLTLWNTSGKYWSLHPEVCGDYVAWVDYRNSTYSLCLMDLKEFHDVVDEGPGDDGDGGEDTSGPDGPLFGMREPSQFWWIALVVGVVTVVTLLYLRRRGST